MPRNGVAIGLLASQWPRRGMRSGACLGAAVKRAPHGPQPTGGTEGCSSPEERQRSGNRSGRLRSDYCVCCRVLCSKRGINYRRIRGCVIEVYIDILLLQFYHVSISIRESWANNIKKRQPETITNSRRECVGEAGIAPPGHLRCGKSADVLVVGAFEIGDIVGGSIHQNRHCRYGDRRCAACP